jgi:hypothetical protein
MILEEIAYCVGFCAFCWLCGYAALRGIEWCFGFFFEE